MGLIFFKKKIFLHELTPHVVESYKAILLSRDLGDHLHTLVSRPIRRSMPEEAKTWPRSSN